MSIISSPWALGLLVLGAVLGYLARWQIAVNRKKSAEAEAKEALLRAETEAKEIILEAKNKAALELEEARKDEKRAKDEVRQLEEHVRNRESALDTEKAEIAKERQRNEVERGELGVLKKATEAARSELVQALEKTAGLTREEAREKLLNEVKEENKEELSAILAKFEREKRDEVEKKSSGIIVTALQRYARSSVADVTTSVVNISDDGLKGKIIGKEGRNVKAFERATGVEVVVDEAPESILLSSFDPMRREVARIALLKLIKDGRIQPARIEELVEEARQELDETIRKTGEEAAYDLGILDFPKEIIYLLGRLNYRTSYGQNVLHHSIEMAHIAGMIASELGLDADIAKRGALIHDIGKAIDHEVEGTHVEIGRKILKKHGVDERVIQAMEAHHDEYPYAIPEAYVVAAADAISGARPGARRDTVERYLKRVGDIEKIAQGFPGVTKAYAISGGREVRVFVVPEKIDDFGAFQLAKDVAIKIKADLRFPGEIRVVVVREVRAIEYAR